MTPLVGLSVDRGWPSAAGAFGLAVGGLVTGLADSGLDAESARVEAVAPGAVGLVHRDTVRSGPGATGPTRGTDIRSVTAVHCGLSPRCPAVTGNDNGRRPGPAGYEREDPRPETPEQGSSHSPVPAYPATVHVSLPRSSAPRSAGLAATASLTWSRAASS